MLAGRERGWRKQSGRRLGVGWLEELVGGTLQPCDSKLAEQSFPSVRLRVAVVEVEGEWKALAAARRVLRQPALNLGPVCRRQQNWRWCPNHAGLMYCRLVMLWLEWKGMDGCGGAAT